MTLIYAIIFYVSSILITPSLKVEYGIARFLSLLLIAISVYFLSFFIPLRTSFYAIFFIFLILSFYRLRSSKFEIEKSELIFLSVYLFFILLRYLNPAIFDCEKFMDMAFLSSILRAEKMPPNDPFMAGMPLNCYYFFGHLLAACIVLMSFSAPEVGYNIAVAALPAYSALLFYEAIKSVRWLLLTLFSGNAYSVYDFFHKIYSGMSTDFWYYWNSTRVVNGTINEFPYFSFIHADLHAHVIAIPIKLLLIALILKKRYKSIPLVLFALFATNSWDYPLLLTLCLTYAFASKDKKLVLYSLASFPFVIFFYLQMNMAAVEVIFVSEKSDPIQFLAYAAFPLILCYSAFVFSVSKKVLFAFTSIAILSYFLAPVLTILMPLVLLSLFEIRKDPKAAFLLVGALAFLIPEFVAIESRMNTVFKFYLVAWIFLFTFSALKLSVSDKRILKTLFSIFLIFSLIYPVFATPVRYNSNEFSLDGMKFLNYYGEYEAIKWMQSQKGVVMEEGCSSVLCGYNYGGRVAVFSGNPAVIAWTNHEFVWRRNISLIYERSNDVREFYLTEDCGRMKEIAEKYNVSFIFVGYEEKRVFGISALKFEGCFKKVFESGSAVIFSAKNQ
ncbi:MAG: DUF2298 domain-containing protein [Archaeoglobales archaeon]|nr:DUF2298 domain-containing protein [Archaeoglobales archaeon]